MRINEVTPTPAGLALPKAMEARGYTQASLAREIGIAQTTVSYWVQLKTRPTWPVRERLELVLGLPAQDWRTESETRMATGHGPDSVSPPPADESGEPTAVPAPGTHQ
jgi:transcriptional regulator with XRE-family HTH domain